VARPIDLEVGQLGRIAGVAVDDEGQRDRLVESVVVAPGPAAAAAARLQATSASEPNVLDGEIDLARRRAAHGDVGARAGVQGDRRDGARQRRQGDAVLGEELHLAAGGVVAELEDDAVLDAREDHAEAVPDVGPHREPRLEEPVDEEHGLFLTVDLPERRVEALLDRDEIPHVDALQHQDDGISYA